MHKEEIIAFLRLEAKTTTQLRFVGHFCKSSKPACLAPLSRMMPGVLSDSPPSSWSRRMNGKNMLELLLDLDFGDTLASRIPQLNENARMRAPKVAMTQDTHGLLDYRS
ncbi:hypothetical protein MUCCIDRAFT_163064 [Mucor lusitanicus CBS 277.49]|uniref:Uncharacterized protein n=1 Tax=Mucor lusitanicus CBS 277.49 TaxID=747725 RepID=A0A162TCA1_MUCCL|nr:hypothetical protein MUCCIDRAFT_163064 [Mucor lusitanicus CBS 277.49]